MSRFTQKAGVNGSLKWIQRAVNADQPILDAHILRHIPAASRIEWRSPIADDSYAEYRDAAFLERLGLSKLAGELREWWPERGPQWDALALTDKGDVLLLEAKAHVSELFSSCAASPPSREKIEAAFMLAMGACKAKPRSSWCDSFYQLANRITHLHWLRKKGTPAWLVLVNFTGDDETGGPQTMAEWQAAYKIVDHVMGLREHHAMSRYIIHLYPSVVG
jgi:hypothetical protein